MPAWTNEQEITAEAFNVLEKLGVQIKLDTSVKDYIDGKYLRPVKNLH